jgi:hypothetical protein
MKYLSSGPRIIGFAALCPSYTRMWHLGIQRDLPQRLFLSERLTGASGGGCFGDTATLRSRDYVTAFVSLVLRLWGSSISSLG